MNGFSGFLITHYTAIFSGDDSTTIAEIDYNKFKALFRQTISARGWNTLQIMNGLEYLENLMDSNLYADFDGLVDFKVETVLFSIRHYLLSVTSVNGH